MEDGAPQPGWYDDGSGRQRWWDGQSWTEHYASESTEAASATSTEAASATSTEVAAASNPPGWYDDGRGRFRWWDGQRWTESTRFSGSERNFGGLVVDRGWIHYGDAAQPLAGVMASVETAGEIAQRSTFTRAAVGWALLGPVGSITGAMFKKNVDRRELYVVIDGPEAMWISPAPPHLQVQARQFAAWVNTLSRQAMHGTT